MDKSDLKTILEKHKNWLLGNPDGVCASLSGANLSGADLRGVNPRGTILENINWLSYIGIVPDMDGFAYAYKMSKRDGKSCTYPVVEINYCNQNEFSAPLDTNVFKHCSTGINLATFQWCLSNKGDDDCRLFLMFFKVSPENVCTPVGTDGKFRVAHCTKIGECDWNGNLLKDGGK